MIEQLPLLPTRIGVNLILGSTPRPGIATRTHHMKRPRRLRKIASRRFSATSWHGSGAWGGEPTSNSRTRF